LTVLVTDGEQRSALAAVRSLGRAGVRVAVAGQHPCLAGISRWCAVRIACPSAADDRRGFVARVSRAAEKHDVRLIIPASDASVLALSEERARLPAGCALPLPEHEAVVRAMDRLALLQLASSLGVAFPRTWQAQAKDVPLPAVVKARRGVFDDKGAWQRLAPVIVRTSEELSGAWSQFSARGMDPMIQEYVPGEGWGLFALCDRGKPLAAFAHRRIREKPPDGGVSVVRESIAVEEGPAEQALALLKALQWTGLAMVEFRRDVRQAAHDGSFKLMEINPRIWGSVQLAIDCGVDFPRLLYEWMVLGREPARPPAGRRASYRAGVRSRWLMGDLDYLSIVLRRGNGVRLPAIASFFGARQGRLEIERASDPVPAVQEKIVWAADTWRALVGRIVPGVFSGRGR
jgi:predicted ATP-grasp superfamily ATP-dependent carboligase